MDSLVSSYNEPGLEYGEANSMLIFTEKFGKDRSSTVLELYAHSGGNDVGLYTYAQWHYSWPPFTSSNPRRLASLRNDCRNY